MRDDYNQIVEIDYDGAVSDTAEHIERAFCEHYREIFTDCSVDVDRFKKEFLALMPRLEDSTKEILGEPISEVEVKSAIESMHPGKSLGPGGLTAGFYKCLKGVMSPVLADVYNEAFELKELPASHTVPIPKSEEPVELRRVNLYRPICLTNGEIMKHLAKSLQTAITELVGPH